MLSEGARGPQITSVFRVVAPPPFLESTGPKRFFFPSRASPCHPQSVRQLLPDVDTMESRWIARTKARLRKLYQARPQQITGRQIFFREMVRKSKTLNQKSDRVAFTSSFVMQRHGQHWNELRSDLRNMYERRALTARSVKQRMIQEAIQEQEASLSAAQSAIPTVSSCGGMFASNCPLSDAALRRMQQLCSGGIYTAAVVKDRQQAALQCPKAIPEADFASLTRHSSLGKRMSIEWSEISKGLAHSRKDLTQSIVACQREDEWHWFKFCLARLQPLQLVLIPLEEMDNPCLEQPPRTVDEWRASQGGEFQQYFRYTIGVFEVQDAFADVALENCFLLRVAIHKGPRILATNSVLEPLGPFLQHIDVRSKSKPKAKSAAPSASDSKRRKIGRLPTWMMGVTHGTQSGGMQSTASSSAAPAPQAKCPWGLYGKS